MSIDALRAEGMLVVAAAGNHASPTTMAAPACIANALSVGAVWDDDVGAQNEYCNDATTAADQVACYSNASTTTDVLAPGGVIEASSPGGGTLARSGTSHAAPMVSACIAALRQAAPEATPDAIEAALEQTGVTRVDAKNGLGYPRVDCAAALEALAPGSISSEDDAGGDDDAGAALDAGGAADGGAVDAAVSADAATDAATGGDGGAGGHAAGASGRDAATPSGAAGAGGDAALDPRDAAAPDDAGARARGADDGCSCTSAQPPTPDAAVPIAIVALALRRRRRSR